ncbi:hypothetical protein CDD83_1152 [Cordyceps sp. RAO-2017]|nr:hypothetical protein CDD83_1152 [Cordyceps sp. RAO-2017]
MDRDGSSARRRPTQSPRTTSPTGSRNPALRVELADDASEGVQSPETVRRRTEGNGYGSIQSSNTAAAGSSRSPVEPSQDRSSQQRGPSQSSRPGTSGPDRVKSFSRQRKPPLSRRISSNTPHRGEIFSADDDTHEVEADAVHRQRDAPSAYSTRRRQQQPSSSSRLPSYRAGADEDAEPDTRGVPPTTAEEDEDDASQDQDDESPLDEAADGDSDSNISDAESFTLKDRQQAINQTHPFGIRVWKPALPTSTRRREAT